MTSTSCPDARDLEQLLADRLTSETRSRIELHLDQCAACQLRLEKLAWHDGTPTLTDMSPSKTRSDSLRSVMTRLKKLGADSNLLRSADDGLAAMDLRGILDEPTVAGDVGQLGRYRILETLGQGSMGIVLKGHDTELDRVVAIKVLHPALAALTEARTRFLREARAAAAVQDDHLVTIHDVEPAGALPFIVMEFVAGQSLQYRIDQGKIPVADVLRWALDISRGLVAAHSRGLIHRDIKPANILVHAATGKAKVTDFGLARAVDDAGLTLPGVVAGTPEFMSPEQAAGAAMDARSDLFSLGLVFYAMITGRSPLRGQTTMDTLRRICTESPPPLATISPAVPRWFGQLVEQLLEKDPAARVGSAREVVACIERQASPERAANAAPRGRRMVMLSTVLLLVVVALSVGWWMSGERSTPLALPPVRVEEPPRSPGFYLVSSGAHYDTLVQAVTDAVNGETIEVVGEGPFVAEAMDIKDRAVTLRAAAGSRPVFVADPVTVKGPFMATNTDLSLSGIEIRWKMGELDKGYSPLIMLNRCAILSRGGELVLEHCRIICEDGGGVATTGPKAELRASHLVTPQSPAVFWLPERASALSFVDSVIDGRAGFAVANHVEASGSENRRLTMNRCTLVGETGFMLMVDAEDRTEPIAVDLTGNLLEFSTLCVLAARRGSVRPALPPDDAKTERMLRGIMKWVESGNVYEVRREWVECSQLQRPRSSVVCGPRSLDAWLTFWGLPSQASTEAEIEFEPRQASSSELPRWPGAAKASVGAPIERVGPSGVR